MSANKPVFRREGTEPPECTESRSNRATQGTEPRRIKAAEQQSRGGSHATQVTDELPPLATRVAALPDAVQLSLAGGLSEDSLFIFARAIKAFEVTNQRRLSTNDLQRAFVLWWSNAKPLLQADDDFDEWRLAFDDAWESAKHPLGANVLAEAIRRADTQPPPPAASRYRTSAKLQRLVAVCYQLQVLAGDGPFFLSVRDAARIVGTSKFGKASTFLSGLVRDDVLKLESKGVPGGRRASRFRFKALMSGPAKPS